MEARSQLGVILMPKEPRGEKRPADAIGLALLVGRIATGEVEDTADESKAHHREGGKKGGGCEGCRPFS